MKARRQVRAFGDAGLVAEVGSVADAHGLAAAVGRTGWAGVEDVVVGLDAVTVVVNPTVADVGDLATELAGLPAPEAARRRGRLFEITASFDGADLEEVAGLSHLSVGQVVESLTSCEFVVGFLGFVPGFAYLLGLPAALAAVPRRSTPRPKVPAGSLAVGGGFAGIYPQASPGGWHLIGHSAVRLFDPETPPFSLLRPGDRVRLVRGEVASPPDSEPGRRPLESASERSVVVESPGMLTLIEDLGRIGAAAMGVPRAGGADPFALRLANRLVGNDDSDAAIEVTGSGPALRFACDAHVAVVGGGEVAVDGRDVATGCVVPIEAGQVVSIGRLIGGMRAYLAVGGGIEIPPVVGSRSSDVLVGLGPGPLVARDALGLGPPGRPHGRLHDAGGPRSPWATLRIVPGPDVVSPDTFEALVDGAWQAGGDSDRVGLRLRGDKTLTGPRTPTPSRGMVTGAIQVPPDGDPIVLLCDHATVGGYPVAGTVVSADLGVLAQCRPGDVVRFQPVDVAEACRARSRREQGLDRSVVGWFPVRTD